MAQTGAVERLYVMDCGHNAATDQSRWSPGVNVGKPIELSDNCYLIKHGTEWLLWDTGYLIRWPRSPSARARPARQRARRRWRRSSPSRRKTGRHQYLAVSHTHGDHVGNVDMFPNSTLLMQKAEFDFAFTPDKKPPFKAERPIRKLDGDLDVFGDGSVTIIATPGHTPGRQSLLVHLRRRAGWSCRVTPSTSRTTGTTSACLDEHQRRADLRPQFKKIEDLMAQKKAQLWINHDKPQSQAQKRSPQFYD